ncbi:YfhO family protein [Desemzia sp. FAM 23991]|uniref:YfhO family protein n=1 Tax=unclassified Desemzia TaxID=2685243 RepID=UPI0038864466
MTNVMKQLGMTQKKNTANLFLWYSLFFIVIMTSIYGYFVYSGTSFIWQSDGFTQHYLLFEDYVSMWREFLLHPTGGFQFWDWTIGLGADVITSYGYYVVGDPFVYLGLLFPSSMMEFAFHFLIVLRIYCIGLAFIFYARKLGFSNSGILAGVFVYTFAHYVTLNATRHPFFLMPMVFFPLLCLGVEKILRNETAFLFAGVVFVSAASNFYFFYKLTILIFIYAIFRYLDLYRLEKPFKEFWSYFFRALYSYLVGVCMSAVVLFPVIWGFLQSSRGSGEMASGMTLYPLQYYIALLANGFISESYLWTVLGFAGIVMLVIPLMFTRRKLFGSIPFMLILFTVMLLFPLFGSIMNGFSGPYNRWTFAIPLFLGIAVAQFYQYRFDWTKKDRRAMAIGALIFGVLSIVPQVIDGFSLARTVPLIAALVALAVIVTAAKLQHVGKWATKQSSLASSIILLSIIANVIFNAQQYYYPFGQNKMSALLDYGTADEQYAQVFDGVEEEIPDVEEEPFRIGLTAKDNHIRNHMIYLERMGMTSYLSITNGAVAEFASQLEVGSFQLIQPVRNGFDDRRIANHVMGVQYIVTALKNEKYLPYGYEVVYRSEGDNAHLVAETDQAYPFAYANDAFMSNTEFEKLNPVEKEEFLSTGFTADEEKVDSAKLALFEDRLTTQSVDTTISSQDEEKITIDGDKIYVQDSDGKIAIRINDLENIRNSEVYVYLEGLNHEPKPRESLNRVNTSFNTTVAFNDRNKIIHQSDELSFSSYIHREKMLFNLGYQSGDESDTITLQFEKPGVYDLEEITVYALPMDEAYDDKVAEKRENQLMITNFENERVSGTISSTEDTVLVTSMPYSIGWSAKINGEEIDPIKVNYGFIGIPLEAGESEVLFSYQTPFFKTGLVVSVIGFALYGFEWWRFKKKVQS